MPYATSYATYLVTRKQLLKMRKALECLGELYEIIADKDGDFSFDFEMDDLESALADFPDAFRELKFLVGNIGTEKEQPHEQRL